MDADAARSGERLVEGAPEARTVLEVAAALPTEVWTRQTIKEGSQGPMVAEFAALRVIAVRDAFRALTSGWCSRYERSRYTHAEAHRGDRGRRFGL